MREGEGGVGVVRERRSIRRRAIANARRRENQCDASTASEEAELIAREVYHLDLMMVLNKFIKTGKKTVMEE